MRVTLLVLAILLSLSLAEKPTKKKGHRGVVQRMIPQEGASFVAGIWQHASINVTVRIQKPFKGAPVGGNKLWEMYLWFSKLRSGKGERIGTREGQVLSSEQRGQVLSPGEIALYFQDIGITADLRGYNCRKINYICASFISRSPALKVKAKNVGCTPVNCIVDPCAGATCEELPCPEDLQHTYEGSCCPECPQDWGVPPCEIAGNCGESLDLCALVTCEELPCPKYLQHTYEGSCCPECPPDWGVPPCVIAGNCGESLDLCALVTCQELLCPEDLQHTYEGSCCRECPQDWGVPPCEIAGNCGEYVDFCAGVTCRELPCPEDVQQRFEGLSCCPECPQDWGVPPCVIAGNCSVFDDMCAGVICRELSCSEDLQQTFPWSCCPECPQDWGVPPCEIAGNCGESLDLCALVTCEELPCPKDLQHTYEGSCCPECPRDWGVPPCEIAGNCGEYVDFCAGVTCWELPCPEDVQQRFEGLSCCPECPQDWGLPPCVIAGDCVVFDNMCAGVICRELSCSEDLQQTFPWSCCPECPQDWGINPCDLSGDCEPSVDPCAGITCEELPCPEHVQYEITMQGSCSCPVCPADWGVPPCVVVGNCEHVDHCDSVTCRELTCPEDLQYTYEGDCCPECPQDWGIDPCELSGLCGVNPCDPRPACIEINDPVCGSDGHTYSNGCLLGVAAICDDASLTQTREGRCSAAASARILLDRGRLSIALPKGRKPVIRLDVAGVVSADSPTVKGDTLWRMELYSARTDEGNSTDSYEYRDQVLDARGASSAARTGKKFGIRNVRVEYPLWDAACNGFGYLCARFRAIEGADPTLGNDVDLSNCVPVDCP